MNRLQVCRANKLLISLSNRNDEGECNVRIYSGGYFFSRLLACPNFERADSARKDSFLGSMNVCPPRADLRAIRSTALCKNIAPRFSIVIPPRRGDCSYAIPCQGVARRYTRLFCPRCQKTLPRKLPASNGFNSPYQRRVRPISRRFHSVEPSSIFCAFCAGICCAPDHQERIEARSLVLKTRRARSAKPRSVIRSGLVDKTRNANHYPRDTRVHARVRYPIIC